MTMEHQTPEQLDALGRMSRQVYDEYKNLGFSGIKIDPVRFLAFREQTQNDRRTSLVVSDAGVFFEDSTRKVRYKFHREYLFVYQSGLHPADLEKADRAEGPLVVLDNLLEFWHRPGTGMVLVADHLNKGSYLLPEQKAELERIQKLYHGEGLVIRPMLQKKAKGPSPAPGVQVVSLED